MLFNNSNVTEDGFSYSSTPETQRITAVTVDYLDERDNYILKSEYVEDAGGIKDHGYTHVKIAGIGITRRGEAHRLCQKKILDKQLEKELIQFQSGLQASYLRVGDVVDVMDNNKISHRSGGRIIDVTATNKINIDIPVSAITGATKLFIQVPVESDDESETTDSSETGSRRSSQFKEYTITGTSGFEVTTSETLDENIKKGSTWMVKENLSKDVKPRQYRIKSIKEISPLKYEIVGMEYVKEKYEQIDASAGSGGANVDSREYFGPEIIVS
jgi:predicted phage tail protein